MDFLAYFRSPVDGVLGAEQPDLWERFTAETREALRIEGKRRAGVIWAQIDPGQLAGSVEGVFVSPGGFPRMALEGVPKRLLGAWSDLNRATNERERKAVAHQKGVGRLARNLG